MYVFAGGNAALQLDNYNLRAGLTSPPLFFWSFSRHIPHWPPEGLGECCTTRWATVSRLPSVQGPFFGQVHNGNPAQKEIGARHDPPRFPQVCASQDRERGPSRKGRSVVTAGRGR